MSWQRLLDVATAIAVGVLTAAHANSSAVGLLPSGFGLPVAVVVGAVFVVRRRAPLAATVVAVVAMVGVGAAAPIAVATYTTARRYGARRHTWIAGAVGALAVVVPWGAWDRGDIVFGAFVAATFVALPLLFGLWLAQRAELLASLRARADDAERERDLRAGLAVDAERARIARELHDVVAHRISQITVQAGALEVTADAAAARTAAAVRETGALALAELREMLGVLRTDDQAPLRPSPTLHSVAELVDDAVAAGQQIDLAMAPVLPVVSDNVARAVYRLIQESLTNAAKHAAGAEVHVSIRAQSHDLLVAVRNGPGERTALPGAGVGLIGMRERVELAGGRLEAAPRADGFVVEARFPLETETRTQ